MPLALSASPVHLTLISTRSPQPLRGKDAELRAAQALDPCGLHARSALRDRRGRCFGTNFLCEIDHFDERVR